VTTSRLNSCGNFFGIATSFRPGHPGHKECQPTLQQTRRSVQHQCNESPPPVTLGIKTAGQSIMEQERFVVS